MGIDTSAVAWFGFKGVDDFEWPEDGRGHSFLDTEGDDSAEVVFCGWYDGNTVALAVPGTVTHAYRFGGKALGQLPTPTAQQIHALKDRAERLGWPMEGEPQWYFSAHQS